VKLGSFEYQHSVIMDDNAARIREEPGKEAARTLRFLAALLPSLRSLVCWAIANPSRPF
jgi:hypothetical protein